MHSTLADDENRSHLANRCRATQLCGSAHHVADWSMGTCRFRCLSILTPFTDRSDPL